MLKYCESAEENADISRGVDVCSNKNTIKKITSMKWQVVCLGLNELMLTGVSALIQF